MNNHQFLFFFLLLSFQNFAQTAAEIPLNYGPHSIGFQYDWVINYSQNSCSKTGSNQLGKAILLGIWYPAKVDKKSRSMSLRDYIQLNRLKGDATLVEKTKTFGYNSWLNYTLTEDYADSTYEAKLRDFEQSINRQSKAIYQAPKIKGKFPVIIYHHGADGTYDDNTETCEYYASHGYIVISSSFLHCKGPILFESMDWVANISDIQTIIHHVQNLQNANPQNIGMLGHSRGAQLGYAAISGQYQPFKCFVALDPTWDGKNFKTLYKDWGQFALLGYIKDNELMVTTPILHISTFRNNIGIDKDSAQAMDAAHQMQLPVTDLFVHSERVQITTSPEFGHESFIAQGAYDYLRMQKRLRDTEELAYAALQVELYQLTCHTTLLYFNQQLKGNTTNQSAWSSWLDQLNWKKSHAIAKIHPAKPRPKLEEEWIDIISQKGVNATTTLIQKEIEEIGYTTFSHENLAQFFFRKNRPLAKEIVDHYAILWPGKWKGLYLQAVFAINTGQEAVAKKLFEEALAASPPEWMIEALQTQSYSVW